jgi:hypothetical protein
MKIHLEVIRSEDCGTCNDPCCRFDARYTSYAPLFTDEQRRRVQEEFPAEGIAFEPHGGMWRIQLREMMGTGRCICPLLDVQTGFCCVYSYGIFDCDTYPYQLMERDGRLLLTVTPECTVVGDERMKALQARGEELLPRMREVIARHPEHVTPYYEGVIVLSDLGPAPAA